MLKIRGRRVNLFLLAQGRSRGILLHWGFRDRVAAIKAKVNHSKMGDTSGLLTSQGRGPITISTSLDT